MPIIEKNPIQTGLRTTFNNELTLEENDLHILDQRINKIALAQTIQNLFFFRKGNFPNQPLLGIGIEDYLFELASEKTLNKLESEISNQINMFIPSGYIVTFEMDVKETPNQIKYLSIEFTITDYDDQQQTSFSLIFGRNRKTKNMISRLIA